MANIAIIPARGGSKRIPRKNIKDFLGKPIIAYSIETAIQSSLFDEVMVSTDDDEIAEIAKKYGAKVPFLRSKKNSDDMASTSDVISEVLGEYEILNKQFDFACCIYPTNPLMTIRRLIESKKKLVDGDFDAVFPVLRYGYPVQRALKNNANKIEMVWPEYLSSRTQDLEIYFHDAGQYYWMDIKKFKLHKKLFSSNSGFIELSEMEAQDIDNSTDWDLAELKFVKTNKIGFKNP